ncbi:hypothetical protein ACIPIC_02755 [Streptomyces collinus]|uniref:hypothetical protein n=1 Tax=Streptomyces collinus TaxID=42684 RepID=UPI003801E015
MTDQTADEAREHLRAMAFDLATSGGLVEPRAFDAALDAYRDALLAAAPAVQAPAADRAALREQIAETLVATSRADWPYTPGQEKWDHHKHGDRPGHTYAISCALCTNDVDRLADAVLAVLPAPTDRAAVLSQTERGMLRYALDLAQEQMFSRGDEFGDGDQAAVDSLRRMADEAQPAEAVRCTCADAGAAFAPAGHYADCPAAGAQQDGAGS